MGLRKKLRCRDSSNRPAFDLARGLTLVVATLLVGCDRVEPREGEVDAILGAGAFLRIAATTVGGDRLEFWHEPRDECFGPFLIVARDRSGRFIDFCGGEFRSSSRPYCQSERYCALVASTKDGGAIFFVYDSRENRFTTRAAPTNHVHDGFVIVEDTILFSSCKTPEPVWLLDLESGREVSLGGPALQGAEFHVDGSTVLVMGNNKTFELAGETLTPSSRCASEERRAAPFDGIREAPHARR